MSKVAVRQRSSSEKSAPSIRSIRRVVATAPLPASAREGLVMFFAVVSYSRSLIEERIAHASRAELLEMAKLGAHAKARRYPALAWRAA